MLCAYREAFRKQLNSDEKICLKRSEQGTLGKISNHYNRTQQVEMVIGVGVGVQG